MHYPVYRYVFAANVPLEEVEASLLLAIFATESLHGESEVRLEAGHYFEAEQRTCVVDGGTQVSRDLNRVFIGFLRREFGEDSFRVERAAEVPRRQPEEVQIGS
jgi:hypothetical protein